MGHEHLPTPSLLNFTRGSFTVCEITAVTLYIDRSALSKDEAHIKVGLGQLASQFLDDLVMV
jgi:hypothetical protein